LDKDIGEPSLYRDVCGDTHLVYKCIHPANITRANSFLEPLELVTNQSPGKINDKNDCQWFESSELSSINVPPCESCYWFGSDKSVCDFCGPPGWQHYEKK